VLRNKALSAKTILVSCLIVVAAGASACTTAQPTAATTIPSVPTPTPTDSTLALPLDAYAPTSVQLAKQDYVLRRAEQVCMRGFGFDYLPELSPQTTSTVQTAHEVASRRYGVSDETIATTRGYHLSSQASGPAAAQSIDSLSNAERLVLTGAPNNVVSTYDGKQIPPGGCRETATPIVVGSANSSDDTADLVAELDHDDFTKAMADSRVKVVIARWSACMKNSGFSYADPFAAVSDPRWNLDGPTPSALEIRTALTDIACKLSTNLLGVAFAVESDYQLADISRDTADLARAKQDLNAEVERVDQLWNQFTS
jgi:hypothetical protein